MTYTKKELLDEQTELLKEQLILKIQLKKELRLNKFALEEIKQNLKEIKKTEDNKK